MRRERLDLTWIETSTGQVASLLDCEVWAAASSKKSRESLETSEDEFVNRMAQSFLDPDFEVSELDGVLTLQNDAVNYRISEPLSCHDSQMELIFRFDVLNAYHKNMTVRKMLPYSQLEVNAVLERRGMFPGRIEMEQKTRTGIVKFVVKSSIAPLTEDEASRVRNALETLHNNSR